MLFAACISLSSVLPQQGQTNILSFNVSVSFNVPHLEQYFVVGSHLLKTTTLSWRASLDLRRLKMLWCILDEVFSLTQCFICSSCITTIEASLRMSCTILLDMSFFLLLRWVYSFLNRDLVLCQLLEYLFCLLSLACSFFNRSLSSTDILYLSPLEHITVSLKHQNLILLYCYCLWFYVLYL